MARGRLCVFGFAAEVLGALEVEAQLPGQSGWRELGMLSGQAEMVQDFSHDGELGDVSDNRERAAALGAIQASGKVQRISSAQGKRPEGGRTGGAQKRIMACVWTSN